MILWVEDEPYFMDIYQHSLEEYFRIVMVGGPDEALVELDRNGESVELVILDIMMEPGLRLSGLAHGGGRLTGLRLFEIVRERYPAMLVLFFTAVTNRDVLSELRKKERCMVLLKPVTPRELLRAINGLLAEK